MISSELLRSHHLDRVENEVLMICVSLFASEIMTKGLSQLIQDQQFDYLHTLYNYYSKIGKCEELKTEVTAVIAVRSFEGYLMNRNKKVRLLTRCRFPRLCR